MIDLGVIFFFLVFLFGAVGYLRGWQREVLAMAGLVASLAALSQFIFLVSSMAGFADSRDQFWVQAIFHSLIAFFSYQMVGNIADRLVRGRLGDRLRSGLESRITGLLFGMFNGYLYIGALWGFLEYVPVGPGYQRLLDGQEYPFSAALIARPFFDTFAYNVAAWLPQHFSATVWLVGFFVVFFIVIVALI